MADITLVKISALPAAEQIGAEDLLPVVQEGATKAVAYGVIKDDIAEELAPDATLSEAGKAADAKAVGDALALKADKTELTADVSRIDAALATKANTNDVNAALALKADTTDVNAALALKADKTELAAGLAIKADKTELTAALALKADVTAVTAEVSRIDAALNTKVNNTAYTVEVARIDGAIATKADATATTAALATKANANEVTEALALKADAATVNAQLATKANADTVNAALALKADKTELTAGLASKQNVLTFDSTPTEDSTNPVTSGGVYTAINTVIGINQYFNDFLQNKFINRGYNSAYEYLRLLNRVSIAWPIKFANEIPIEIASGYNMSVITWAKEELSSESFISDSGWKSGEYTIPKNTYVTFTVRKSDNASISIEDAAQALTTKSPLFRYPEPVINHSAFLGFAHRGYSYGAPQNTLPAIKMAHKQGFSGVEIDLRITADNQIVLIHDATIDATSNGTGNVADKTLAELKELDFGSRYLTNFAGTKIPTLDEALAVIRDLGLYALIEIKNAANFTDALVGEVVEKVKAHGMINRSLFLSGSWAHMDKLKAKAPNAAIGINYVDITEGGMSAVAERKTDANTVFTVVPYDIITDEKIAIAKNYNIEVFTFQAYGVRGQGFETVARSKYISAFIGDFPANISAVHNCDL